MRAAASLVLIAALASCSGGGEGDIVNVFPEPPPPAPLSGTWKMQTVVVVTEVVSPEPGSATAEGERALMPPRIGDEIVIGDGRFVSAAGRTLSREACEEGGVIVGEYVNQVGDEFALFTLECRQPEAPVGEILRIVLGAEQDGRLTGLMQFERYGESLQEGTPMLGVYRVALMPRLDVGEPVPGTGN